MTAAVDWHGWQPTEHATLLFVIKDGRMLLIRKKRGLGAGKINGPGGRVDPGEAPRAAAVREVREELEVTPLGVAAAGELCFQFLDGYGLHVWVFTASDLQGSPAETDEAIPLWVPLSAIPYDSMWPDDAFWFPHMLAGRPFAGRFVFDGEEMVSHAVEASPGTLGPDFAVA